MENESSVVTSILDPAARTGIGRNNKPWTQAMCELQNGAQVRIFMPIKVGDRVESYDNNGYKNWRIVKAGKVDQSELLKMVQLIYDDLQVIKKQVGVEPVSNSLKYEDI